MLLVSVAFMNLVTGVIVEGCLAQGCEEKEARRSMVGKWKPAR